jgi:hypothetical protein
MAQLYGVTVSVLKATCQGLQIDGGTVPSETQAIAEIERAAALVNQSLRDVGTDPEQLDPASGDDENANLYRIAQGFVLYRALAMVITHRDRGAKNAVGYFEEYAEFKETLKTRLSKMIPSAKVGSFERMTTYSPAPNEGDLTVRGKIIHGGI